MLENQDAHEYLEKQAISIKAAIENSTSEDTMPILDMELLGQKLTLGLWSIDVCHILATAMDEIINFAKSQYE